MILINKVRFDPTRDELDQGFVSIKNFGNSAIDMTAWSLRNHEGDVFTFPSFRLEVGALVKVHTGPGVNTDNHLYWMSSCPIWGDIRDRAHCSTPPVSSGTRCVYAGVRRWALC